MPELAQLLRQNRAWAAARVAANPQFFRRLCDLQQPDYLWIGCSDSRVPANEIVGLAPGELFVHRNVANIVSTGDPNCMATVQYAIEVLGVRDVIVCGHYGCGGVRAVLDGTTNKAGAHVDRWLAPLQHLVSERTTELLQIADENAKWARVCEWNVIEQVRRLLDSDVLVNAHLRGIEVCAHGWIYDLHDGIIHDLGVSQTVFERAR